MKKDGEDYVLYNTNRSGQINAFTKWFELVDGTNNTFRIQLKDGVDPTSIPAKDMVGWVAFTAKNAAGKGAELTYVKITLSWKK